MEERASEQGSVRKSPRAPEMFPRRFARKPPRLPGQLGVDFAGQKATQIHPEHLSVTDVQRHLTVAVGALRIHPDVAAAGWSRDDYRQNYPSRYFRKTRQKFPANSILQSDFNSARICKVRPALLLVWASSTDPRGVDSAEEPGREDPASRCDVVMTKHPFGLQQPRILE